MEYLRKLVIVGSLALAACGVEEKPVYSVDAGLKPHISTVLPDADLCEDNNDCGIVDGVLYECFFVPLEYEGGACVPSLVLSEGEHQEVEVNLAETDIADNVNVGGSRLRGYNYEIDAGVSDSGQ